MAAGGSSGVAGDPGGGRADGHVGVPRLAQDRRAGTAGYDPDMLVMVLMWAYAHGVRSSRDMERLCRTDVAFRVICAGNLPDHVTFARFRAGFAEAVGEFLL